MRLIMEPLYSIGEKVSVPSICYGKQIGMRITTIVTIEINEKTRHFRYLCEFKDKTRSWKDEPTILRLPERIAREYEVCIID